MVDRGDRDGGDDESKTKAQLIAEIEELRRQLAERDDAAHADGDPARSQPALARPITRRTTLTSWVAPVILSVPFGAMIRPGTARAGTSFPTMFPTQVPTQFPTAVPTSFPTAFPTSFPTAFPTLAPTDTPTATPTQTPTDTPNAAATQTAEAAATATAAAAATATAEAAPPAAVPALSPVGLGAAVAVLAGGVAARHLLKARHADANDENPDDPQEDSGDERGTE